MVAVKTLARVALVVGVLAPLARGGAMSQGTVQWVVPWSVTGGSGATTTAVAPVLPPGIDPVSALTFSNGTAFSWLPAPAPSATNAIPIAATTPAYQADGFINFGSGPYAEAGSLTSGGALPWYDSPVITQLYGGVPSAAQQAQFSATVLNRVEQTYQKSGVPVTLTTDPNVPAAHTLSVVSGTAYASNPDAIGITDVGSNGFSFIDKLKYAGSVDELEWVVAHNVAHELMHAFGGGHHDTTGQYLDAAISSWSVLASPDTAFSAASVSELLSKNFRTPGAAALGSLELLDPDHTHDAELLAPVPEPATWLCWGVLATAVPLARRAHARRRAAA